MTKPDYEKVLRNPINDKNVPIRDTYRREKEYQAQKNRRIHFQVGEQILHPKFGKGNIEQIEQMSGSVRLVIRFADVTRSIDQQWLLKTSYRKIGEKGVR